MFFTCTAKRPDQANNKRPTLGHTKSNNRYREGYHYQPIASTSQQSPTFVLDDPIPGPSSRANNHHPHQHHQHNHNHTDNSDGA